jgi:hypothetical protein
MMSQFVGFAIHAYWGARREAPREIGIRFWRMLDSLAAIGPAFSGWRFMGTDRFLPLPTGPGDELTRLISNCVDTADDGDPTPINGYRFGAGSRSGSKSSLTIEVHAGSYAPNMQFHTNTAGLRTRPLNEENIGLITSPVFRAALLAIAAAWDATWCGAYPWDIIPLWPDPIVVGRPTFKMAWITYLSPRFAPMVTPPRSAIVEYTPQGGIVMTATEERFDVANPAHLAAAREIEAALAPVNALPWPPDEQPGSS